MKKNVNYEKPSISFVSIKNQDKVAGNDDGPCMSQASHGHTQFFYDAPGDGWVVITTKAENCNGKVDFEYYDNPAIEGSVDATKQAEAIKKAEEALNKDKQAFTGAYLDPQPSWS